LLAGPRRAIVDVSGASTMCGRYNFLAKPEDVAEEFGLPAVPAVRPRYNVAPTQQIAAVGLGKDGVTRGLVQLRCTWPADHVIDK
jgi:putative SOS response-associated peptidase YedK